MSRRLLVGTFTTEHDLLEAARASREYGYPIVDAYTPYPVHGLDEALGLKPSRLSRVCLLCGLIGVGVAMAFQQWTSAIDWPINVGGRPFNSWPAFVPVAFEVMVLLAGFGVVFAFLGVSRLYPGKAADGPASAVTDDEFVLMIEARGAATDTEAVLQLFQSHHAICTEEDDEDETAPEPPARNWRRWNWVLGGLLAVTVLMNWTLGSDPSRPNAEFLPEMVRGVAGESFGVHAELPRGMVMQTPEPGVIARGQMPLHYQATPKDAERAGEELTNPLDGNDARWQARGAAVYANTCQVCHGASGKGDGPVSQRGIPPPPSYLAEKALKMKDGQMFHVLTFGQVNMASYAAQVSREDRWAVILHLRKLQKTGAAP